MYKRRSDRQAAHTAPTCQRARKEKQINSETTWDTEPSVLFKLDLIKGHYTYKS